MTMQIEVAPRAGWETNEQLMKDPIQISIYGKVMIGEYLQETT